MDRARQPQRHIEGENSSGRLLIPLDAVAARAVAKPRGMGEKAGGDPARYGAALEIVETKFLFAIGEHIERDPLPELGRQFGIRDCGSRRIPSMAVIDFGNLGNDFGGNLMLPSNCLDFLRDRRKGQPDHPLADSNFRRGQAADLEEAHQRPHGRRRNQQGEQHKTGSEDTDELADLGGKRGIFRGGQR